MLSGVRDLGADPEQGFPLKVLSFFLVLLARVEPFRHVFGGDEDPTDPTNWKLAHMFLATMAQLQMIAAVINLIPIPPLDGFQIVGAYMDPETRHKFMSPPYSTFALVVLFLIVTRGPGLFQWIFQTTDRIYLALGFDYETLAFFARAYNDTLGLKAPM